MLKTANLTPDEIRFMPDSHPLAPLVDALQANLAAYFRRFVGLPGVVLEQRDEIGWFYSAAGPPGTEVLWTCFDEATCDRQIDNALAEIGAHSQRFDWAVYRTCQPVNVGQRLEAKGMKPGSVTWLLADLTDIPQPTQFPEDFRIEVVTTAEQLREWWHVSAAGFESPIEKIKVYHDAYERQPHGPGENCIHYIGYWQDRPVTSATLLLAGGIAAPYDISTPAAFRRRGFGTAITYATLQTAKERGYRHACIMASAMGKPIYQALGFNVQVKVPEYQWYKGL